MDAAKPIEILKRKDFARWQAGEKLPDSALCEAVKEMESGVLLGVHCGEQNH